MFLGDGLGKATMQQVFFVAKTFLAGVDLDGFTLAWEEGAFWVLSLEMLEHVVTLCNFMGLKNRKLELGAPF